MPFFQQKAGSETHQNQGKHSVQTSPKTGKTGCFLQFSSGSVVIEIVLNCGQNNKMYYWYRKIVIHQQLPYKSLSKSSVKLIFMQFVQPMLTTFSLWPLLNRNSTLFYSHPQSSTKKGIFPSDIFEEF